MVPNSPPENRICPHALRRHRRDTWRVQSPAPGRPPLTSRPRAEGKESAARRRLTPELLSEQECETFGDTFPEGRGTLLSPRGRFAGVTFKRGQSASLCCVGPRCHVTPPPPPPDPAGKFIRNPLKKPSMSHRNADVSVSEAKRPLVHPERGGFPRISSTTSHPHKTKIRASGRLKE